MIANSKQPKTRVKGVTWSLSLKVNWENGGRDSSFCHQDSGITGNRASHESTGHQHSLGAREFTGGPPQCPCPPSAKELCLSLSGQAQPRPLPRPFQEVPTLSRHPEHPVSRVPSWSQGPPAQDLWAASESEASCWCWQWDSQCPMGTGEV